MRLKWCKQLNIKDEDLRENKLEPIDNCTNGLILELYGLAQQRHLSDLKFASWLRLLLPTSIPTELSNQSIKLTIKSKLYDKKKRLATQRKDSELKEYENQTFVFSDILPSQPLCSSRLNDLPRKLPVHCRKDVEKEMGSEVHPKPQEPTKTNDVQNKENSLQVCGQTNVQVSHHEICSSPTEHSTLSPREIRFKNNELGHDIQKKKKYLFLLGKRIAESRCQQKKLNERYGVYKPKNVKRRDKRHSSFLKKATVAGKKLEEKCQQLERECNMLRQRGINMSYKIKCLGKKVTDEQRMKSHYKRKWETNMHGEAEINKLKAEIQQLRDRLTYEESKAQDTANQQKHVTLKSSGVFTHNIRMCCLLLTALEVAAEKVPEVIRGVAHFVFLCDLSLAQLPGRQVVQNIVDEGQYLVKRYYEERLQECHHFGVKKDATSRQRRKIVTSCLRLDTGEVLPCDFNQVASETAEVIAKNVQEKLSEVAKCGQNNMQNDMQHSLNKDLATKMTYTMSDRASNEKASNALLDQWRNQIVEDAPQLHHFHCMAHPLLGFHTYIVDDFKKMQAVCEEGGIVFGRDVEPVYKIRFGKQCVATRVSHHVSDLFGPGGDFRNGVQEKWTSHCTDNNINHIIPKYEDNRFNALFECAAAAVHHRLDIIDFITKLRAGGNANLKVRSVLLDLQDDRVMGIVCALALTYCHITHPYWNMVTSDKVEYLQLYSHLQKLYSRLLAFKENPKSLLENTTPIFEGFPPSDEQQLKSCQDVTVDGEMFERSVQCVMSGLIRCCEKQLCDFLGDGKYASEPTAKDLQLTSQSGTTTLEVERQFGSLDASMARRRHATLHYHSTVLMLKANRKVFFKWLEGKHDDQLWASARKFGSQLRIKHKEQELKEKELINEQTEQAVIKKQAARNKKAKKMTIATSQRCKRRTSPQKSKRRRTDVRPPSPSPQKQICLEKGIWVAVAYESAWYPGCILERSGDLVKVDFLHQGRGPNYKKPEKPDISDIETEFIFSNVEEPMIVSRGRRYRLKDHSQLQEVYEQFQKRWKT